jgi:hypothetical protein
MASKQKVERPQKQRVNRPKRRQIIQQAQTANVDRSPVRLAITEDDFLATVIELATLCGWLIFHDYDSRRNPAGFPDLVLVHPHKTPGIIFAELKTNRGKLKTKQGDWLNKLAEVIDKIYRPPMPREHIGVYLWRPQHWDKIEQILMGG